MKCYLCLKEISHEEMSMDHVPAHNIFPKPKPSNLITVPSHIKCNNAYSHDEEKFRADIVSISDVINNNQAKKIWQKVKENHVRLPGLRYEMCSRILFVDKKFILGLPKKRVENVAIKIAKGLQYNYTKKFIDGAYKATVYFQPTEIVPDLLKKAQYVGLHENTFSYAGVVSNSNSIWWLSFYASVAIIVVFSKG